MYGRVADQLEGELDKPFLMSIEDVFSISGRGTVATGKVERGTITKGTEVEVVGLDSGFKTVLTGIGELRGPQAFDRAHPS